MEEFFNYKRK
ncbi:hypothetical protein SAMN02910456_01531 [Ruminococcaceae bacterium YRB3002]|nr:hypothetical protein SAMN02910456_01531 [Ruminococcaceae bacterium YRB3002]